MQRPLQPQFKVRLYARGVQPDGGDNFSTQGGNYASKGDQSFIDIENCVAWGVTYEEEASLLNTLSFTIDKHADVLLHRLYMGQWIVFYGGHYADGSAGVRKVFSGTITRIRTRFPDSGEMTVSVECMSYGFTQLGKDNYKNFTYPDPNSPRSFAKGRTSLKLRALIEGIVGEAGMQVGEIKLPKEVANETLTKSHIRYQKGVSDWKFLLELGESYGCSVWTETSGGVERLYFVDTAAATNKTDKDISFVYPLKGVNGVQEILGSEIIRQSEAKWNRPRVLRDVNVDEDISMAYAVSRSASYFDWKTGEYKEAISAITEEEGKKVITFYELDESKVEYISHSQPELAEKIRHQGAFDMPWTSGCKNAEDESPHYARYYYRAVKKVDESVAVFDKAFFGITVTASCNMDLDIRSQRSYDIRGICRYSSSDKTGSYFLRGLKHIWGKEGGITELDFIK